MSTLLNLFDLREDLEEIRDHIKAILTRDDPRAIDSELEAMLKVVEAMLEGKITKPRKKRIMAISGRILAIREELEAIREEVEAMREDLESMLKGDTR